MTTLENMWPGMTGSKYSKLIIEKYEWPSTAIMQTMILTPFFKLTLLEKGKVEISELSTLLKTNYLKNRGWIERFWTKNKGLSWLYPPPHHPPFSILWSITCFRTKIKISHTWLEQPVDILIKKFWWIYQKQINKNWNVDNLKNIYNI